MSGRYTVGVIVAVVALISAGVGILWALLP